MLARFTGQAFVRVLSVLAVSAVGQGAGVAHADPAAPTAKPVAAAKPVSAATPVPPVPASPSAATSAPAAPALVEPPAIPPGIPVPRRKPAPPPVLPTPRAKPDLPPEFAAATPPASIAALLVSPEVLAASGPKSCGDACGEILFKIVDDCLWVQSQNPKAIAFQTEIAGKPVAMLLEGASAIKADAEPVADGKPKNISAYHARQRDPFQSSSAGIPVYRARLGEAGVCVKERSEITHFMAKFLP